MPRIGSVTNNDTLPLILPFAPLKARIAAAAFPERQRHWLRRERERSNPPALAGSDFGGPFLPDFFGGERRPRRQRDHGDRAAWIAIAILSVLGIAFLIFAILNPELIATTFGTY